MTFGDHGNTQPGFAGAAQRKAMSMLIGDISSNDGVCCCGGRADECAAAAGSQRTHYAVPHRQRGDLPTALRVTFESACHVNDSAWLIV